MRVLLLLGRVGIVALAFILIPGTVDESGLAGSHLCAAEADQCVTEVNSYCIVNGVAQVDFVRT